ncbi:MAG TPA: polysaccharide deacetylase family protein, partial [Candidatus Limnocylindria bacterium]|nr:polysaccharide deacetylase family protein [Candidatus Limnocylindria bacterium]
GAGHAVALPFDMGGRLNPGVDILNFLIRRGICATLFPTGAMAQTGQRPVPYWRPPYGSVNSAVIQAAAAAGYTKTFMWDIDTVDWNPISDGGPTAQQIATKVITQAESGSNVLMHLGGYETLDALRIMVPGLRDRGFRLTSLSDLLH